MKRSLKNTRRMSRKQIKAAEAVVNARVLASPLNLPTPELKSRVADIRAEVIQAKYIARALNVCSQNVEDDFETMATYCLDTVNSLLDRAGDRLASVEDAVSIRELAESEAATAIRAKAGQS